MRKYILALTLAIIMLISLFACSKGKDADILDAPNISYEGFTGDTVSGGAPLEKANLRSISLEEADGDTRITLDFCMGSAIYKGENEMELRTLPDYKITLLSEPFRLKVEIGNLDYTDYLHKDTKLGKGAVCGSFTVSSEETGAYALYFQLSSEAVYKAEENSGKLSITLRPVIKNMIPEETPKEDEYAAIDVTNAEKAAAGEAYYVLANAFDMYRSGELKCGDDMAPTLASDLNTIMLISRGLVSKEEAERLMQKLLAEQENPVSAQWSVIKLKNGELPHYSKDMEFQAAYEIMPYSINSMPQKGDIAIPGGLFLSVTPDKSSCLYSYRVKEYGDGGSLFEYEKLMIMGPDGTSKDFSNHEFEQIASASYSPDGRKLAVLEMAGESAHLYVFDVDSHDLITDLSAVGFGDTISTYCWDSMGGRLFSISGSSDITVHQYDFNVPTENKRHTDVDKKGCDEGSIGFVDGEVYFCESTMENQGMIYRIKPEGGLRREFIKGDRFRISADGRYMAYTQSTGDAAGEQSAVFAIKDMQSGEVKRITGDFSVYSFFWSLDGTRVYYFENKLSGDSDETAEASDETNEYPYTLWVYELSTGVSREVADLTSMSVMPSARNDMLYICYTDRETLGSVVRSTYELFTGNTLNGES